MAWTTPRTWVAGETVTAAILNVHVRDNDNHLKGALSNVNVQDVVVNAGAKILHSAEHVVRGWDGSRRRLDAVRMTVTPTAQEIDSNKIVQISWHAAFTEPPVVVASVEDTVQGAVNYFVYGANANGCYIGIWINSGNYSRDKIINVIAYGAG